jgi:hypothetical protein
MGTKHRNNKNMKDPNNKELNTDHILVDGGEMFGGDRDQFANCFFDNADNEQVTQWCRESGFSLSINGVNILGKGGSEINGVKTDFTKEEIAHLKNAETITLTKEELQTFAEDCYNQASGYSDTSYRIAHFLGIDPTDGI